MSEKRRREGEKEEPNSSGEFWPQSRVESLDKFLRSIREHVLSNKQLDVNPLEIALTHVSANRHTLTDNFFPSWPCMSPDCAVDDFESCPHVPRTSSSGSSGGAGGDISVSMLASSPWCRKREDLSPPPCKFAEGGLWEYPSGSAEEYRRGLAERIGYPCIAEIQEGMRLEHCNKIGCDYAFCPRNNRELWAGTKTTPKDEWHMVVEGTKAGRQEPPACQMSGGRRRISIDELLQLPLTKTADLCMEEIIGLALYTGPMYEIYNCILHQRGIPPDDHWSTFQHNHFPTTLCAIVSAVQKLGAVTSVKRGEKLYRGNGGKEYLPKRFFDFDEMNVRGMTAYGFQSFTTDIDRALKYAKPDETLPMVFVVEPTADPLSGFADVSEFSQFPHERERLLPPCSFLHPDALKVHDEEVPKHGRVQFVPMRATASQSPSLQELAEKKKKIHVAEFENRVAQLREQLEKYAVKHNAEDRLRLPSELAQRGSWKGKVHSVKTLLDSVVAKVKIVLKRHEDKHYSEFNTKRYADIVQESLDCVRMAPSLLKLWLRDKTEYIHDVTDYPLLEGHRWFVGFLKREYHSNPGDRQKIARKLCKHLGLLSDANQSIYGETPLMHAAATGLHHETLEFLVSSGENLHAVTKKGACALHLAADNGHDHCIRALVRLGAAVDQAYDNGKTALHRACMNSHSRCVVALASLKADVNKTSVVNGKTPMAEAAQRGFHRCIEELARYGADLDKGDNEHYTPLWIACQYDKASCVATLLRLGAKPNLGPRFNSPLRIASRFGHFKCVHEFRRIFNVSLFQKEASPMLIAIANKHTPCVHALLDLKPPKDILVSALFAAIWFENFDIVRALVIADIAGDERLLQSEDEDGLTAEQLALACGSHERMIALLRSSGDKYPHATAASDQSQDQVHWMNVMGPRNALCDVCITCSDTLRFYSPATALSPYGCRSGVCAYYEVTIRHPGLVPQFGLCSAQFAARFLQQRDDAASQRGIEGVGDFEDTWAVDGVRCKKWNGTQHRWNVDWQQGDVIGIACDMRARQMIVSLNGVYSPPNGVVFDLSQASNVVYPALFTSIDGHLRANLGHSPFKHAPPSQEYVAFASLEPFVENI